jgi:hypothetical protein
VFELFDAKCCPSQMAFPFPNHMGAESLLVTVSVRDCSEHTRHVRGMNLFLAIFILHHFTWAGLNSHTLPWTVASYIGCTSARTLQNARSSSPGQAGTENYVHFYSFKPLKPGWIFIFRRSAVRLRQEFSAS